MALEGTYPIIIDGELAGKLTVTAQGGRTVFDAVCRPTEGLVRISVYGGGAEGCLGVLAPENGGLSLHKTMTRTELRSFPREIESVERSGLARPAAPDAPEPTATVPQPEETDDFCWYSSPDGALVCFDGVHSLIALPIGDERIPAGFGGQRRTVEGKEYMVYITKNFLRL